MNRKDYQRPTMEFIEAEVEFQILAGSQVESVGVQNYDWQTEDEE